VRDVEEELEEAHVAGVAAEVLAEHAVHHRLQDEAVVDRQQAHAALLVPARLAAPRHRLVHNIVGDEEEGLEPLDAPGGRRRHIRTWN
jgi:hypothetical protein